MYFWQTIKMRKTSLKCILKLLSHSEVVLVAITSPLLNIRTRTKIFLNFVSQLFEVDNSSTCGHRLRGLWRWGQADPRSLRLLSKTAVPVESKVAEGFWVPSFLGTFLQILWNLKWQVPFTCGQEVHTQLPGLKTKRVCPLMDHKAHLL